MATSKIAKVIEIDKRLATLLSRKTMEGKVGTVHSIFSKVINFMSEDNKTIFSLALDDVIQSPMMMKINDNCIFSEMKATLKPSDQIYLVDYKTVKIAGFLCEFSQANEWERDIKSLSHLHNLSNEYVLEDLNQLTLTLGKDSGLLTAYKKINATGFIGGCKDKSIYVEPFLKNLIDLERATRERNLNRIYETSLRFVGLGVGLTPSGDDFLLGCLAAWQYLQSPIYSVFEKRKEDWLAKAKIGTTALSYFMLESGMKGSINNALYALIEAISKKQPLFRSFKNMLSIGSTSGTDMLIGVCFALRQSIKNRGGLSNVIKSIS